MIPTRWQSSTANPTTPVHQRSSRIFGGIVGGFAILAVLAGGLYIAAPAADPEPRPAAAKPVPAGSGDLDDPGELERFLDETIAAQLADHEVPGATVSVVKDGKVLFAKGYGVGNVEESRPVVASDTMFRIGSVTKLFTWTAVMQLVEEGRLDLNADVNSYLENVEIPATYPQPITMAALMTHTAGFEDRQLGLSVLEKERSRPLAAALAADMPARIYAPGEVTAYSNYGAALAGHIVEQISGEPLDNYLQRHVLEPLGMRHSTLRQELGRELTGDLAVSYQEVNGKLEPLPREHFDFVPAAGMSATATDMAHFMIAHLQEGRFADNRILKRATAQDMHRQHFANDPRLSGMALGFAEQRHGDDRILMHPGSTNFEQFQSYLMLVPDRDLGLFVSFNSAGGGPAKGALVEAFLDRYLPQPPPPQTEGVEGYAQQAPHFAGSYQSTRMTKSNIEKLAGLIPSAVEVSANADGTLTIAGGPLGDARRWLEVKPSLFREVGGWEEVAFAADSTGHVTSMFADHLPIVGFTKQQWWEKSGLHLGLLAGSMAVFLTAVIGLPIVALRNRWRRIPTTRGARLTRGLAWLASLLFVAFPVLLIMGLADLERGISPLARSALAVGLAGAAVAAALAVGAALAWRNRHWGLPGRVYITVIALTALEFMWFLHHWNLLGFRL
jgi:CubicO group peptidase (beta-lactamase class C family)